MRGRVWLWGCVLGLAVLSVAGYVAGVGGLVDAVLIAPSRPAALQRVDLAASRRPADVVLDGG